MRGKFIVVEGLEGAGKSSVIGLIVQALKDAGKRVEQTREPGGTPMAEAIRECVKHDWDETVSEETELLLMYAARVQLLTNKILPSLDAGAWVVGDRHDLSSQAYQGGGRGELDRIEQAGLAFFERTRAKYLSLAKQDESIVVVSAMQSMEKVHQDVTAIINDYVTTINSASSDIAQNESMQGKG